MIYKRMMICQWTKLICDTVVEGASYPNLGCKFQITVKLLAGIEATHIQGTKVVIESLASIPYSIANIISNLVHVESLKHHEIR